MFLPVEEQVQSEAPEVYLLCAVSVYFIYIRVVIWAIVVSPSYFTFPSSTAKPLIFVVVLCVTHSHLCSITIRQIVSHGNHIDSCNPPKLPYVPFTLGSRHVFGHLD